jgi:imidazolonepropionase-like amidohydrolase
MKPLRIEAGLLVDGGDGPPVVDGAVLVVDGRIRAAGPRGQVPAPDGADTLAYPGLTLLPGLVDCHSHINLPGDGTSLEEAIAAGEAAVVLRSGENCRKALASGVTTLADNGALGRTALAVKAAIDAGIVPGPRLFVCGRALTITGGHAWPMGGEADGADGVRRAARQLFKEGADFLKVMATGGSTRGTPRARASFNEDELRAAVDEAHAWGRMAMAHATGNEGIARCVHAGFDVICHCSFYDAPPREKSWPALAAYGANFGAYRFRDDLARRMADAGIPVNPTLQVHRDRLMRMEARHATRAPSEAERAQLANLRARYEERVDYCRRLLAAGVELIAGSDAGWGPPFDAFPEEIAALVEVGMTPAAALRAGTSRSARALGIDDEVGSLKPGRLADLLLVEGDPSVDPRALKKIRAVFLGGRRVPGVGDG